MNTFVFDNKEVIEIREWKGERVIAVRDLAKIIHASVSNINLLARKTEMIDNVDFFNIPKEAVGYQRSGKSVVTFYTKSGVEKIIGKMRKEPEIIEYIELMTEYFAPTESMETDQQPEETPAEIEECETERPIETPITDTTETITNDNCNNETADEYKWMISALKEGWEAERKANAEFRNQMLALVTMVIENNAACMKIIENLSSGFSKSASTIIQKETKKKTEQPEILPTTFEVPEFKRDFGEWLVPINEIAVAVAQTNRKFRGRKFEVFAEAYNLLRKEYGVCWEQYKKEFVDDFGRSPKNNLELAHYMECSNRNNENLLFSKLCTMYNEAIKEAA